MKRVLVIGAAGNIGSKLVPFLVNEGHLVYACDQLQGTGSLYSVVNILSVGDLLRVFDNFKPEIVFHLAAMVSRVTCEDSPNLAVDTNLSGLNNVIQLCKQYKAKLIYFSTSEVYGNIGGVLSEVRVCHPNNLYGLTKYMGEQLVRYNVDCGLDALIVRPFMFYDEDETRGDHRSAMIRFCYHLSRGEKIEVHRGSKRSWMHISDAVRVLEALMHLERFEILNIGSDELISTEDLARKICVKLNRIYSQYVHETELPARMTLEKIPDVSLSQVMTGLIPEIDIDKGIDLVLSKMKHGRLLGRI